MTKTKAFDLTGIMMLYYHSLLHHRDQDHKGKLLNKICKILIKKSASITKLYSFIHILKICQIIFCKICK